MEKKIYRIIKKETDRFIADVDGESVICCSRKKNKKDEILIGDFVNLQNGVIEGVELRKNRLIRPAIANIDQVIFVVCSIPKPDYYLLDKAIINCLKNNIDIVICINKCDINEPEFEGEIKSQYMGREVITVSAIAKDTEKLKQVLSGKMSCLAGQSAVGKSTIVNAIFETFTAKVGELSAIGRGKNTTTSAELYKVCEGYLADTPGFSMLDIFDLDYRELNLFYPEFEGLSAGCRYHCCTHTDEPDCAVKIALNNGEINVKRFERYLELFSRLKIEKLNKFK